MIKKVKIFILIPEYRGSHLAARVFKMPFILFMFFMFLNKFLTSAKVA